MQPSILSCQIFWTSASVRISVEVLAFGPFPQFGGEVADREPGPGLPFKSHWKKMNKMKPTNPNAHTYVNGTDVKTHGYAVTHNTFLQ